jgi:hypothetical protein
VVPSFPTGTWWTYSQEAASLASGTWMPTARLCRNKYQGLESVEEGICYDLLLSKTISCILRFSDILFESFPSAIGHPARLACFRRTVCREDVPVNPLGQVPKNLLLTTANLCRGTFCVSETTPRRGSKCKRLRNQAFRPHYIEGCLVSSFI